jgi:fibronectin-binding autotransporter adhesin
MIVWRVRFQPVAGAFAGIGFPAPTPPPTPTPMKIQPISPSIVLLAASALLAAPSVHAANYYWDNNGSTAGFGDAGGTWASPTTGLWSTSNAGTATPGSVTTGSADTLFFGYSATGLGAGTITVSGTVNAREMIFPASSGAITFSGGMIRFEPFFAPINLPSGTANTGTILVGAPDGVRIESSITGASGVFVKSVVGNVETVTGGPLTLAGVNYFTGPTINRAGVLVLGNSLALQNSPLRTSSSVAGTATAGLRTTVPSLVLGGLEGGRDFAALFSTVDGGYSGLTGLALNPRPGRREVYTGGISDGAAGMTVEMMGLGTQVLAGVNTYTGGTTVNALGVLLATAPAALPGYDSAGKVTVTSGTLGVAVGGGGWSIAQVDTLLANANKFGGHFGIDTSNGDLVQWTPFTPGNLGALGLHKLGGDTLTLNQANSYTGATILGGGTLRFQNPGSGLSHNLGALVIGGDGGTLESDFNGGSGTLATTFSSVIRELGSSANIVVTGGSNGVDNLVNLGGAPGFIDRGIFFGGSEYAARDSTDGFVRALAYGTDMGTSAVDVIGTDTHVKLTTAPAARPGDTLVSLNLAGDGVNYTMDSGALIAPGILKSGGGTGFVSGGTGVSGGGAEMVLRADTAGDILVIAPPVTGADALTKSGMGTVTLAATGSNYNGDTRVNGGVLESARTTAYSGNIAIAEGAAFHYVNASGSLTLNGQITGAGTLVKSGTGTLTLNGVNSFTGGTVINGGTIAFQKIYDDAFGTGGDITFNASAALTYSSNPTQSSFVTFNRGFVLNNEAVARLNFSGNTAITGPVTGDGGIWSSNSNNTQNTLTLLSTENTFTGPVILNQTNIQPNTVVVNSLADGPGRIIMQTGNNTTNFSAATFRLGAGAVAPLVLDQRQFELAGTTSLGVAAIDNANADPANTITVNTGLLVTSTLNRTFTLTGTNTGANTFAGLIANGATAVISVTKSGTGNWILSGDNTYGGLTTVGAGQLTLAGDNSGLGGNVIVNGTGRLNVTNPNSIGPGLLSFGGTNGPSIDNTSGAPLVLGSNNAQSWLGDFAFIGSDDLDLGSGAVTLGGTRNVTVAAGTLTVGGTIGAASATPGLQKSGAGTLVLGGANTYQGGTSVSAGVLLVNGSTHVESTFTVGTNAVLGGSGVIGGAVTVNNGGTLAPGASIESLATGSLVLDVGSAFAYEIDNSAAAPLAGDLVAVSGDLALDPSNQAVLVLAELGAGSWALGSKLTLISYSGVWNGGLFSLAGGPLADDSVFSFSGAEWRFNYNDTAPGTNFTGDLTGPGYVTMTVVPEPATALLAALGLLAFRRRR